MHRVNRGKERTDRGTLPAESPIQIANITQTDSSIRIILKPREITSTEEPIPTKKTITKTENQTITRTKTVIRTKTETNVKMLPQ